MDSTFNIRENSYNLWTKQQKQERTINNVYRNRIISTSNYIIENGKQIPVVRSQNRAPVQNTNVQKIITDPDHGFYRVIYKFSTGVNDGKALVPLDVFGRETKHIDTGTTMTSSQTDTA